MFFTGLISFALLSALSALSPSAPILIALRAALVPSSLSLIAAAHPVPASRAKAMGVWAALSGTGLVAGPLLGGLLTQGFGRRAIFLVNVPVAVAALTLSRSAPPTPPKPGSTDVAGQLSAIIALSTLTYALVEGRPWLLLGSAAAAAVVGSAPPELAGTAGGALNASRQTGAVLGVAVLGALLNSTSATTALVVAGTVLILGAVDCFLFS
ncbi:hypothetical protein GCM10027258_06160 [Amycolatopsis stemonae]